MFSTNPVYMFTCVYSLCLLSWNRNGNKLLSAATDNTACVWDVMTGECDKSYRFPSPVLKAQFHPRDRFVAR